MRVVKKRGNSAPVRVTDVAWLRLEQPADVREKAGRNAAYDLATLLAGITDENRHEAVAMGPPVGKEVW